MKKRIWQIMIIAIMMGFISCEKRAIGVNATIMEYGDTEECQYMLILKDELNNEKWYVPSNLPEEFKTYHTKDVIVSIKRINKECDCYPKLGDYSVPREDLKETFEKVKIKDIELK